MKLIKEEIQFIENYLIKNEVKYWDVRIELLDHIVSAVEDKIEKEGISFNEALLDVHQGFGNKTKIWGVYNDKLMKSGLYADNKGFKSFTMLKQKELGRKYRKQTWRQLKSNCISFKFLIEYAAIVLLFFTVFQYFPKAFIIIGLLVLMIPQLVVFCYTIKDKSTWKSLSFNIASSSAMFLWTIYNMGIYIFKDYYEDVINKPYIIFVVITCLCYPFIRTLISVYINVYKKHKGTYNLKFS